MERRSSQSVPISGRITTLPFESQGFGFLGPSCRTEFIDSSHASEQSWVSHFIKRRCSLRFEQRLRNCQVAVPDLADPRALRPNWLISTAASFRDTAIQATAAVLSV